MVAAAADLQFALDEMSPGSGARPASRSASRMDRPATSRRQIEQGAPFELFLSADEAYVFAWPNAA